MNKLLLKEYQEATEGINLAQKLRHDMANRRAISVLEMYEAGYSLIQLSRILKIDESRIRTLIKRGRIARANQIQKDE